MLELINIKKDYKVADDKVHALQGVNMYFRKNEFVAILGPSGCGKTTLLNIIGGLDRYTDGDLVIRGTSTKKYKDKDWDFYRNHTIGFVFQTYNLIPHQTVLENVELALTLSGVSKKERRKKAIDALTEVGLADKINNKPNQLSGGQMQRVAIARALVNNPDILLADEPTGALDTKTSIQIMEILKRISKNKLIIMVTHNPQLAEEYANRTIKLVDGLVIDDSNPCSKEEYEKDNEECNNEIFERCFEKPKKKKQKNKTSMSFWTALSLSFNNLLTKKARTLMVAFAGSIGIIGIALILSVSNGFQNYINKVQEDTLSTYPISLESQTIDYTSMFEELGNSSKKDVVVEDGVITSNDALLKMVEMSQKMTQASIVNNNLEAFKKYIEETETIKENANAIQYVYDMEMNIFNPEGFQVLPDTVFQKIMGSNYELFQQMTSMMSTFTDLSVWSEILDNEELIHSQYDLLDGKWPNKYNEIVIVVDENNQINDYVLYSLGLKDNKDLENLLDRYLAGEKIESEQVSFKYEDILNLKYHLVLPYQKYEESYDDVLDKTIWKDVSLEEGFFENRLNGIGAEDNSDLNKPIELEVVGILRPKESSAATSISGSVGYMSSLVTEFSNRCAQSKIMQIQKANPKINVFTGSEFVEFEFKKEDLHIYIEQYAAMQGLDASATAALKEYLANLPDEQLKVQMATLLGADSSYEGNLKNLGSVDFNKPIEINIFPKDFAAKETISDEISNYNKTAPSNDKITYTDYIGLFLSSITVIIDVITYVLIAFVSISLVVSSIMIGVITYISVLERTKEIGILRSIGARKNDISRVFTAETIVIGFTAGAMGILITILLIIPINLIINSLAGFPINAAALPFGGAIILIAISVVLTVIAGLLPSKLAAKRDPVIALRSE